MIAGVYLLSSRVDIMNIDAAQYASMSREMLQNGHYLELYDRGKDYLDKPPMLFWITSQSMRLFGINNFAYKFPSVLFALLAAFCTFRLAALFYSRRIALLSALVLASSQALFLITNDVRTDTMLMGWVALALWQLAAWMQQRRWLQLFIAFVAMGCGMLTKGPIAIMVPAFAFGAHLLLKRNFKQIFRWEYLLGILIIAVVLTPFCIGLYRQFDLHPEKIMYGRSGTSGIRFFLWTQSFGRITGESTWNNGAGFFFQLQNLLWGFLPWIIFFLAALVWQVKELVVQRFRLKENQEWITTGGFILTYCAVASSHYQLPHYIYVALPLAAIMTARFLNDLLFEERFAGLFSFLYPFHLVILSLLWLAAIVLSVWPFPQMSAVALAWNLVGVLGFAVLCTQKKITRRLRLLLVCIYSMIGINIFLSGWFYPALLQYQWGSVAGKVVKQAAVPPGHMLAYRAPVSWALCFYAQQNIKEETDPSAIPPGYWIMTDSTGLSMMKEKGPVQVIFKGVDYKVQSLSLKFLDPARRPSQLKHYFIAKVGDQ